MKYGVTELLSRAVTFMCLLQRQYARQYFDLSEIKINFLFILFILIACRNHHRCMLYQLFKIFFNFLPFSSLKKEDVEFLE